MEQWKFPKIKVQGFQNEFQEGFIEVTPDAGIPYRRERFSDVQDIVSGSVTLTKQQYIDFMSWYKTDIDQGAIPFTYFDCRTKKERVARIVGKPTFQTNSKYFDVNITLAFNSGVIYEDRILVANEVLPLEANGCLLVGGSRISI